MLYDWLTNMDFAFPMAFALLVLIPALIYWYTRKNNEQQGALTVSSSHSFTVKSWKNRFRHFPFILRLLALTCLIIALARPQKRNDETITEGEGIDIMLCMDASGSMNEDDIKPTRMEAAKEVAVDFVLSRPVDRIGLVIFEGESFTQSPLTSDKNSLIAQIQALSSGRLERGTVIGQGLATAVDRVSKSNAKSKVVILITDGKEDAPVTRLIDPLTALEIAKTLGVKVYTIGVGAKASSSTMELQSPNAVKKEPNSDFLDEGLLRKIAEETGGRYFRARDKDGLKSTYKQIDQLEKSKVEIQSFKRAEERYLVFMLAALAFLFIEMILRLTIFRRFP